MGTKYKNPPLQEAVCEINFTGDDNWDLTYPSDFYAKIKDKFPIKETKKIPSVAINVAPQGIGINTDQNQRYILQCWNAQKNQVVQIADNLLNIGFLKPYPEWDIFKNTILECLNYYKEIAKPAAVERVVLKYINKIDVGEKHSYQSLKNVFTLLTNIPEGIEDATSLQSIIEVPYNNNRDILSVQQATLLPESNMKSPVLFDISYLLVDGGSFSIDSFDEWIENAHKQIENVFHLSLTESFIQKIS